MHPQNKTTVCEVRSTCAIVLNTNNMTNVEHEVKS